MIIMYSLIIMNIFPAGEICFYFSNDLDLTVNINLFFLHHFSYP